MGLSDLARFGIAAGGVSKGISGGIRDMAARMEVENAAKRTNIMEQEIGSRKKTADRAEEEYQRGMEPIPIETARKVFATSEEADYHEGFARSIGAIRRNEDGSEYIARKDARDIMALMKSKELQDDKDSYIRGVLKDKLAKAEKDAEQQPELKAQAEGVKKRLYEHETKMGLNKLTPVAKNTRLVDSTGKVILDADEKERKITSNVAISPQTKKKVYLYDDGSLSDVEATKVKGEGSELADEIRAERLRMAKEKEERDKKDEDYRRQERLDKEWSVKEDKYKKQFREDVEDNEGDETIARKNWSENVASLRKEFEPRYRAIGLNLDGTPVKAQQGGKAAPAKQKEKPQPLAAQKGNLFQKPDGSHVVIGPDGKERPVKLEGNKVIFLR